MSVEYSPHGAGTPPSTIFRSAERRTVASYERELRRHRRTESGLREALAREEALLCQRDELIQQQAVLSQESVHRLLNSVQMIVSLLSLQGRASENAEVASQLAAAADRIATIGRIHRRLHSLDGVQTFALKQYIEDLCRDFSMMLSSGRPSGSSSSRGLKSSYRLSPLFRSASLPTN
jgi:two-component sensor histidine kinase